MRQKTRHQGYKLFRYRKFWAFKRGRTRREKHERLPSSRSVENLFLRFHFERHLTLLIDVSLRHWGLRKNLWIRGWIIINSFSFWLPECVLWTPAIVGRTLGRLRDTK